MVLISLIHFVSLPCHALSSVDPSPGKMVQDQQDPTAIAQCSNQINSCNSMLDSVCTSYCTTQKTANCLTQCKSDYGFILDVTASCQAIVSHSATPPACRTPSLPSNSMTGASGNLPPDEQSGAKTPKPTSTTPESPECREAFGNATSACGKQPSASGVSQDNSGGVSGACSGDRTIGVQVATQWSDIADSCFNAITECSTRCQGTKYEDSCNNLRAKGITAQHNATASAKAGGDAGLGCQNDSSVKDASNKDRSGDTTDASSDKTDSTDNTKDTINDKNKNNNNPSPFNFPSNMMPNSAANSQPPQATPPPSPITPPAPPNNGLIGATPPPPPEHQKDANTGTSFDPGGQATNEGGGAGIDVGRAGDVRHQQSGLFPSLDGTDKPSGGRGGAGGEFGGGRSGMSPGMMGGAMANQAAGNRVAPSSSSGFGAPKVSTDVLKGERGGGGGGFTNAGGGGNADAASRTPASNTSDAFFNAFGMRVDGMARFRGLDLKQYLPGGMRDPARRISGGNFAHPDIRPMGDSLWQSISNRFQVHCRLQLLYDCK